MLIPAIRILDRRDDWGWADAFLLLAVERCAPLLRDAGIPTQIAARPETLRMTAQQVMQARKGVQCSAAAMPTSLMRAPGLAEQYAQVVERLLAQAFATLDDAYGPAQTQALYEWARRHFFGGPFTYHGWEWSSMLARLAGAYNPQLPNTPSPLRRPVKERFLHVVRRHFGAEVESRDEKRRERAADIPLSAVEQRLLALEVVYPGDDAELDVLARLEAVIAQQRAYEIWTDLDQWLTPSDREDLLAWARAEATMMGMPAEWITLPDAEGWRSG
jgi:hypothetical protein